MAETTIKRVKLKLKGDELKHLASLIDYALLENSDALYQAAMHELKFKMVRIVAMKVLNHRVNQTFNFDLNLSETAIFTYLVTAFDHPYNYVLRQKIQ